MGIFDRMDLLNELLECFVNASFVVYTAYVFFGAYLTQRWGKMKTTVYLVTIAVSFVYLQYLIPSGIARMPASVIPIAVTAILFDAKKSEYVKYILIFSAVSLITEPIAASLLADMFWVQISEIYQLWNYRVICMLVTRLLVLLVAVWIRIRRHRQLVGRLPENMPTLLILPILTVAVGILLMAFNYNDGILYSEDARGSILYICYPFFIFLNILVFQHLDDVEEERAREKVLDMAHKLVQMQAKQYTELLESRDAILKLKHDYKNYLLGVIDEMTRGNHDAALAELRSEYNHLTSQSVVSENMGIVHTVIQSKSSIAAEKGIEIEFEYKDLHHLKIPSVDLAVLLGNAVDNAVEAVDKVSAPEQRRIYVSAKVKNNLLVIVLRNPVSAPVDVHNLNTTKANPFMHGYGVIGMKSIAEKYAGEINFTCENLIFETYILLRNVSP